MLESSCSSCLICELDSIIYVGICMQYSLSQESVLHNAFIIEIDYPFVSDIED